MVVTFRINWKILLLIVACVSLFIAASLLKFPVILNWAPSNSSEMASWIQAIGSIGALGGIWWQTKENYENNSKDRRVDLYGRQLELMHGIELLAKRAERYLHENSKSILGEYVSLDNSEVIKNKALISKKLENFEDEFKRFSCADSGDTDTENIMSEIADEIGLLLIKINNDFQFSEINETMKILCKKISLVTRGMVHKKKQLTDILGYKS